MWKRFLGVKKDSSESTKQKEKEQENQITESEEKSTKAMSTIQSTIADLNTKIAHVSKKIEEDTKAAKALREQGKGTEDPTLKALLVRIRDNKAKITKYQGVITQQEQALGSVEDALFVQEMSVIMKSTRDALAACVANADEVADLMDEISEHRDRIKEVSDLFTQQAEEDVEGLDELMEGLDLEIANDINKKKLGVLPDVPTYQFPAAPVPEVNEDDELARQLELL